MNYYYECEGQPKGPVSEDVLRQLHADGAVNDATLVVGEGEPAWVPLLTRVPSSTPTPLVPQAEKSKKEIVSANVAKLASRAVSTERVAGVQTIELPEIVQSGESIFFPKRWKFFYRVCIQDEETAIFLYVHVVNRPNQGVVHYNQAKTLKSSIDPKTGLKCIENVMLELHHIDVERQDDNCIGEHFVISIPQEILDQARRSNFPLRIQVMRPDEKSRPTKSVFIEIDVPAEASAAVAYRLRPDKFEIERIPAKNDMDETHIQGQSAMATAAWSGVGVFLFLWLVTSTGFLGSSLFGFFVAAFIWNQNKGGAKSMPGTAPAQANEVASNNS